MFITGHIVVGDRTSHGGQVISGDPVATIGGKPIARVGDKVSCPRCKRVSTIVTSRDPTVTFHGQAAAFDQDRTDCGAVLLSHHNNHAGLGEEPYSGDAAASNSPAAADSPPVAPVLNDVPRYQKHFVLVNETTNEPMGGVNYAISTGEGNEYRGKTDAQGRTQVVWTQHPEKITVSVTPDYDTAKKYYEEDHPRYEGT